MTTVETSDLSEADEIDVVSTDAKSPTGLLQQQTEEISQSLEADHITSSVIISSSPELESPDCYCKEKKEVPVLWCEKCKRNFHIECLKSGNPSTLEGDTFFKLTCGNCSENGEEIVTRIKLTWQQVVVLALYNLSRKKSGRKGFFRWKEDVCEFISINWTILFGLNKNKSQTWHGTVAGVLSSGSKTIFRSGAPEFGEPGWWALLYNRPPSYKPEQIGKEAPPPAKPLSAQLKKARLANFEPTIKVEGLRNRKRGTTSVESAMELKEKRSRTQEAKDIRKAKQAHSDGTVLTLQILKEGLIDIDESSMDSLTGSELFGPAATNVPDSPSVLSLLGGDNSSDSFSLLQESDLVTDESLPSMLMAGDEEEIGPPSKGPSMQVRTPTPPISSQNSDTSTNEKEEEMETSEDIKEDAGKEELASTSKLSLEKEDSIRKKKEKNVPASPEKMLAMSQEKPKYLPISIYEERQLLKLVEACPDAVESDPDSRRLRRKLLIRKEKRERGLPIFDLDSTVQQMIQKRAGFTPFPYPQTGALFSPSRHGLDKIKRTRDQRGDSRVLDRFQVSTSSFHSPHRSLNSFRARLVGCAEDMALQKVVSPYTARILKPYIRRDFESRPVKLKLLHEILDRRKQIEPSYQLPLASPIDYCYVQPQHIPSVNALCREFFWPGIDLSECLQYPDFSVVVLYRKVVIGFGFMVPDVKYNEAYISFLFVHPEWQRAGIGTFMVYHLIQTCMGKDVTLHVSATNPAMLLYQKFGFKPEELILDFYEKYFPEESRECRHAFFLRLQR